MRKLISLISLLPLVCISACNSKGSYEAVQLGQRHQCHELYGAAYERCIEQYSQPYEDYERGRQEVIRQ